VYIVSVDEPLQQIGGDSVTRYWEFLAALGAAKYGLVALPLIPVGFALSRAREVDSAPLNDDFIRVMIAVALLLAAVTWYPLWSRTHECNDLAVGKDLSGGNTYAFSDHSEAKRLGCIKGA
jgi:hypothetical protein